MMRLLCLAVGLILLSAPLVRAADMGAAQGASSSIWTIDGATVHLRYVLPAGEARALAAPGAAPPDVAGTASVVSAQTSVASAGGDCPAIVQSQWVGKIYTLALTPGLYRYEIIFACPSPHGLVLHDGVLFDRVPGHVDYARVQVDGGPPTLQIFTRDRQNVTLPTAAGPPPDAGLGLFAGRGAERVLGHAERLCVILGLLLLARGWSDLGPLLGALAIGYLAALGIAFNGALAVDPGLAAGAVGLLAVVIGGCALRLDAGELFVSRGWRIGAGVCAALLSLGVLAAAATRGGAAALTVAGMALFGAALMWTAGAGPRLRAPVFAPAAVFGLLDGLGLPADLSRLQLPPLRILPALIGYDVGALAAAAALAAGGMAALWLAGRKLAAARLPALDISASALIGLGVYGFVARLYS
jgi:hypothetical protein